MLVLDIKEMVRDNKKVTFSYYRSGNLYYKTETGFEFPVPIEDTGDATFATEDKALVFMRWIRKHIATINSATHISEEKSDGNG